MKMCRMRVRDVCKGKKKKGKNEYSRHACVITRNAKNRKSTTEYEMLRCSIEHARQNEHSGIVPVAQLKSALGQQRNNISRAKKKVVLSICFIFFFSILSYPSNVFARLAFVSVVFLHAQRSNSPLISLSLNKSSKVLRETRVSIWNWRQFSGKSLIGRVFISGYFSSDFTVLR